MEIFSVIAEIEWIAHQSRDFNLNSSWLVCDRHNLKNHLFLCHDHVTPVAAVSSMVSINKRLYADMPYATGKQFSALWFFLIVFTSVPVITKQHNKKIFVL